MRPLGTVRAAYQRAIDSGHADQAPKAAVNLGVLLQEAGDQEGARAAFQRAIDSDHEEVVDVAVRFIQRAGRDGSPQASEGPTADDAAG